MPRRDDPLAFIGIDHDAAVAQLRRPVAARRHGERAGGMEAMALGQVGRRQPMSVVLAVAQIERHHRAVQQADDAPQRTDPDEAAGPPQRIDLGQGKRRSSGGMAPAISVAAGIAAATFSSTQ